MTSGIQQAPVRALPRPSRWFGVGSPIAPTAVALGVLGWFITFLGSWIPSFWGDEAASVMSAERPLATLWRELGRVDAVHGAYYLFLHFWIDLFGASELSVRFPSTVAVGIVVAGIVVLADLLLDAPRFGRRTAVVAGVVGILLPRIDYMGAEARSYAIGTAIATWLTVWLIVLVRRAAAGRSAGRSVGRLAWLLFAVAFAAAIYVFLYLALLAVVHGLALISTAPGRAVLRRWTTAVAAGVVLAAPVVWFSVGERGQISFLAHRDYVTIHRLLVTQWFGNPPLAVLSIALIALAVASLVRRRSPVTVLLVAWLLVPMGILLVGDKLVSPMYSVRYLSFCSPAAVLLIAVGIGSLMRIPRAHMLRWGVLAVTMLLFIALAIPTDVFQRTAFSKDDGSDLRQVAAVVAAHAHAGDAVVFDESTRPSRRPRLGIHLYPADYAGLDDVTLRTPYSARADLWDRVWPIADVAPRLASTRTVWDIELTDPTTAGQTPANVLALESLGYAVSRQIPVHRTVVYELSRETS